MKNIAEPVHVYGVHQQSRATNDRSSAEPELPNQTSIAVLPFTNLSSDAEQGFFADGLAEDLIPTDLSKVPGVVVIARQSSFAYKDRSIDIRTIAAELGVRYIIKGSVRRSESKVRINAQLIDAASGQPIWAERLDRDFAQIFVVQDEVVSKIVNALPGGAAVNSFNFEAPGDEFDAYELFIRARALTAISLQDTRAARVLLGKAMN